MNELPLTRNALEKLVDKLGSEDELRNLLDQQDVATLASVQGITEKKAISMILAWQSVGTRELLKTEKAQKISDNIIEKILGFVNTPQAKNRVKLLRPLEDESSITKKAQKIMIFKKEVSKLERDEVSKHLKRIKPLTEPKPKYDGSVLAIAETEEIYQSWDEKGIARWIYLTTPDDCPDPKDYSIVLYLYDEGTLTFDGLDNVIWLHASSDLFQAAPQSVIDTFTAHYRTIESVEKLSELLGRKTCSGEVLELIGEMKTFEVDPEEFESWVNEKITSLNTELKEEIASVSLSGDQVVNMLNSDIPDPILKIYDQKFSNVRSEIRESFGVNESPFTEGYPSTVDQEILQSIVRKIGCQTKMAEWEKKQLCAQKLSRKLEGLKEEIKELIEYDYWFGLGCFAHHYDLNQVDHNPEGLHFKQGISLDFYEFKTRQFIDYGFGETNIDRVVLLTGANSGGKTSLLETLAQMTVMASMGLPLRVEDGNIPLFDELYYYSPKRNLDAGGLESFLRSFLPICLGTTGKRGLILADELESMTELEAASKILSTFIQHIKGTGSYAIIVTHMAKEIDQGLEVRVDGIEASGLDDEMNLIVDRAPKKDYFARSTPELILRKLRAEHDGEMGDLYEKILEKF